MIRGTKSRRRFAPRIYQRRFITARSSGFIGMRSYQAFERIRRSTESLAEATSFEMMFLFFVCNHFGIRFPFFNGDKVLMKHSALCQTELQLAEANRLDSNQRPRISIM
jgi:hypothetical protein